MGSTPPNLWRLTQLVHSHLLATTALIIKAKRLIYWCKLQPTQLQYLHETCVQLMSNLHVCYLVAELYCISTIVSPNHYVRKYCADVDITMILEDASTLFYQNSLPCINITLVGMVVVYMYIRTYIL